MFAKCIIYVYAVPLVPILYLGLHILIKICTYIAHLIEMFHTSTFGRYTYILHQNAGSEVRCNIDKMATEL
jgi:hypothetical protein